MVVNPRRHALRQPRLEKWVSGGAFEWPTAAVTEEGGSGRG
jgi:hypothetical protein